MSRVAAVLIGGPPATGKSTLAMALAPRLEAAVLDLDVATAPLTRVVSELTGLHDLDDPALAGLTREARYDTLRPEHGNRTPQSYREAKSGFRRDDEPSDRFPTSRVCPSAWRA